MKIQRIILALSLCLSESEAFAPIHPVAFARSPLHLRASKLERLPDSAVKVTITAPGSATKAAYDKACTELSKSIQIPGFRKGAKIPPQVLEQAMAGKGGRYALREQAINSLLAELIEPALKEEHSLEPIGQPALETPAAELAKDFQPGEDLELHITCDVWPDIEWITVEGKEKPYIGLTGSYKRKHFDQSKFDKAMDDLKERYATLEPIDDDGHELQMGDACVVNMEGFMATPEGGKGEPLPNAASGDRVEVVMGEGRYMTGLVEGLVGAKVGDTRLVKVRFPDALRDKTLAGKDAVFDVRVLEASKRSLPELTDEFANQVRAGLTAESLKQELQKAVDSEDAKEFKPARNSAIAKALAEIMEVEVPDTLVTNQAREKFALMMTDMRNSGVSDEEIKNQIKPENFLKYKKIVKDDIVRDFKVSMAVDEIGRMEGIEVPNYQVDEQMEAIKQDAGDEEYDEAQIRSRVEATLQREAVMDFLAEQANLQVEFSDDEDFDETLMKKLADESLAREEAAAKEQSGESAQPAVVDAVLEEAAAPVERDASSDDITEVQKPTDRDYDAMTLEEKAYYALLDSGALETKQKQ